jgi:hypothetical protein
VLGHENKALAGADLLEVDAHGPVLAEGEEAVGAGVGDVELDARVGHGWFAVFAVHEVDFGGSSGEIGA